MIKKQLTTPEDYANDKRNRNATIIKKGTLIYHQKNGFGTIMEDTKNLFHDINDEYEINNTILPILFEPVGKTKIEKELKMHSIHF